MEFIDLMIQQYTENFTSEESDVLRELNRETNAKVLMPRMLSGHLQGQFLSMISCMIQPERILEVGTYTGYSAICLAAGLKPNGMLHTIDINDELEDMVRKYFEKANVAEKIQYHLGNALQIIPTLNETFDLVFIDADKENYSAYFDLVIDKVRSGGFIIADNVLWSGKVLQEKKDKDTQAIHLYNEKIKADNRVAQILLPIRDGLMIARKL
jgi:caffeoyl-CoA O-methyltransferase